MINEKAKAPVASADACGLSNVRQVVELAVQLSACAELIHERVMREIHASMGRPVPENTQNMARALLDDEVVLRQRANGLCADAATYIVPALGKSQQHVLALTTAAAEGIRTIDRIGDATGLVARLLGVAAAATTGQPAPILLSLEVLEHQLDSMALNTHFKAPVREHGNAREATKATSNGQFVTNDPTRLAMERGELRLVKWIKDGTLIDGKPLAEAWDITRQGLDKARERGEVFSVRVKGRHYYPTEAIHFKRNDLAEINRALGDIDPASKLIFLRRKHGALGGCTPADAVDKGKLMDVVRLAKDWADN
jgi:hypothetical protein